jgi:3-isopropylmalate/(R)-2-methylmalate dehydratase small subunit
LFSKLHEEEGFTLTIDLQRQCVIEAAGNEISFEIDEFRKHCLLQGLDEIGLTLEQADAIRSYEASRREQAPWLFDAIGEGA